MVKDRLEDHRATIDELRERVSVVVRVLGKLGLADYLGHASARVPGTELFVVSPRGSKRGSLQSFMPEDMIVMDIDANVIDGNVPHPGEVFIHSEMYRHRPDVMGVIHDHQRMALIFGIARKEIKPLHLMTSAVVSRPIPAFESPGMISSPERGRAVAQAIGDHCVCHLRGHGLVVVGDSVENAAMNAINLENQAHVNLLAAQIGDPEIISAAVLPQNEIEDFIWYQHHSPGGGRGVGAWKYYRSLLEN